MPKHVIKKHKNGKVFQVHAQVVIDSCLILYLSKKQLIAYQ